MEKAWYLGYICLRTNFFLEDVNLIISVSIMLDVIFPFFSIEGR